MARPISRDEMLAAVARITGEFRCRSPPTWRQATAARPTQVSTEEAVAMAMRLAREEGLLWERLLVATSSPRCD